FGYDLSQWAPETRLAGRLQFEGAAQGRPEQPVINGRVRVERVLYKNEPWQDFSAQLAHAGPRVRLTRAVVRQSAPEARFDLDLEFRHRLTVTAELSNLPVQTLKNLADRQDPVDGRVSGQVHVDGPIETPTARATLTLNAGSLFSQPVDQAQVQIYYQYPQ